MRSLVLLDGKDKGTLREMIRQRAGVSTGLTHEEYPPYYGDGGGGCVGFELKQTLLAHGTAKAWLLDFSGNTPQVTNNEITVQDYMGIHGEPNDVGSAFLSGGKYLVNQLVFRCTTSNA